MKKITIFEEAWEDGDFSLDELCEAMKGSCYVLVGTIGTWQGPRAGGFIFYDGGGIYKAIQGCDIVMISDVGGHLYVDCSHHDGSNHYEIRELTERGKEFLRNSQYRLSERELHSRLMERPYSKLPKMAKKLGLI